MLPSLINVRFLRDSCPSLRVGSILSLPPPPPLLISLPRSHTHAYALPPSVPSHPLFPVHAKWCSSPYLLRALGRHLMQLRAHTHPAINACACARIHTPAGPTRLRAATSRRTAPRLHPARPGPRFRRCRHRHGPEPRRFRRLVCRPSCPCGRSAKADRMPLLSRPSRGDA